MKKNVKIMREKKLGKCGKMWRKKRWYLSKQNHIYKSNYVNVVRLEKNLVIKIDGINGSGIILKPNKKVEVMDEEESSGI